MRLLIVFLIAFFLPYLAFAETIQLKRGIATDTWISWPEKDSFGDAKFVDVYPEFRQHFGPADFAKAKAAGFDFIRFGADPASFLWQPSQARTKKLIAGILAGIADIQAAGLKVVLDMHTIPRADGLPGTDGYLKDDASFAAYLKVVEVVGKAIADLPPEQVAFEPINEPTIDCEWEVQNGQLRWPAMAKRLHETARNAAPKLTLVIHGGCWGGAEGLTQLEPRNFADDNILWSFHNYEPFLFTHQGASWTTGPESYVDALPYPPNKNGEKPALKTALARLKASDRSAEDKTEVGAELKDMLADYFTPGAARGAIAKNLELVQVWQKQHNIPSSRVFLGEFGAIASDQATPVSAAMRAAYLKDAVGIFEKAGYTWSVWSWSGSFAMTDGGKGFEEELVKAIFSAKIKAD
jgi:endoglucanase